MESSPPFPIAPGQRLLAAIVFTDVVSFTSRVQAEEIATLNLLERDFATMRKFSEKYSGSVLKSTGDGLLLYFTSAVHAVACALKMQRHFAERARAEPPDKTLTYRLGIHLGDVFVTVDDVMGDGVNIAARIQAEAQPGGICISQTVYDVVKNKLKLHVARLGPRELKNLKDPIPIYRVLLDPPPTPAPAASPASAPVARATASGPGSSNRTRKLAVAGAAALAMALVAKLMIEQHFAHEEELARSHAAQTALGTLLTQESERSDGGPPGPPTTGAASLTGGARTAEEIDFAELGANRPRSGAAATNEDVRLLRLANERMQPFLAWLPAGLAQYTSDRPLLVRELAGGAPARTVFTDAEHRLYFAEGGAFRTREWADLSPEVRAEIIVSALQNSRAPVPNDVVRGAEAFAYVHGLPDLAAALRRMRK